MVDLFEEVEPLKAVSLWQPWASAIPLGWKGVETRHWKTAHRGEIAIHAAKRWTPAQAEFASVERALGRVPARLPFGAIVAIVSIVDVRPSEELELSVSAIERLYGNYEPGRFGWVLENVRPLREPVGCVGRQSIWTLPDEVASAVREMVA